MPFPLRKFQRTKKGKILGDLPMYNNDSTFTHWFKSALSSKYEKNFHIQQDSKVTRSHLKSMPVLPETHTRSWMALKQALLLTTIYLGQPTTAAESLSTEDQLLVSKVTVAPTNTIYNSRSHPQGLPKHHQTTTRTKAQ